MTVPQPPEDEQRPAWADEPTQAWPELAERPGMREAQASGRTARFDPATGVWEPEDDRIARSEPADLAALEGAERLKRERAWLRWLDEGGPMPGSDAS